MVSGSGSRGGFLVEWSMLVERRRTTVSSSTVFCGFCVRAPAGMIFPSGMASTRACMRGSCAGARAGVWERIFADLVGDKKNQYLMIDSTIVRAHQQAATGRKKGGSEGKALGRSRGGLSTKIHLLADEVGLPVAFRITAGQAAEYAQAIALLEGQRAEAVIADKGYDSTEIVTTIQALGAVAVIPPRRHWKQPRSYDRALYKQ